MIVRGHEKERVTQLLDSLLAVKATLIRREIDASCCQTKTDWDRLHEQQDEFEKAYEIAVQEILQVIAHARRGY